MKIQIAEIFDSIQGEGSWIGRMCTFIRFQGCSLQCSFCDSARTWSKESFTEMSIEDIVERVNYKNVVITGGEPTEQEEGLIELIRQLHRKECIVALESNGTYSDYSSLDCDWVVCSPKPKVMYCLFPQGVNELKYVVTREFDVGVAISPPLKQNFKNRIWLQPCDYGDNGKEMMSKVLKIVAENTELRAGIQLHKVYGVQ